MIRDEAADSSIKKVLPALIPDLSYGDLGIQEGGGNKWKEVTLGDVSEIERAKVYSDLVDYCKLDTLAMVQIHQNWRIIARKSQAGFERICDVVLIFINQRRLVNLSRNLNDTFLKRRVTAIVLLLLPRSLRGFNGSSLCC